MPPSFSEEMQKKMDAAEARIAARSSADGGAPVATRAAATKQRLDETMSRFMTFDTDMRVGTRQRRERDEHKVYRLRQAMAVIERSLTAEAKSRAEMHKSLAVWSQEHIDAMRTDFVARVEVEKKAAEVRVVALQRRIVQMEERFAVDYEAIPIEIVKKGDLLAQRLNEVMGRFDEETADCVLREEKMSTQLADHEQVTAIEFDAQRTRRENAYADLRATLENHEGRVSKYSERFNTEADASFAAMLNKNSVEAQTRENEDQELADAMRRYILELQDSLRAVNSCEA